MKLFGARRRTRGRSATTQLMVTRCIPPLAESVTQVLLVDDDVDLGELLKEYLEPEGFRVTLSYTGLDGVARALSGEFSLVVLDVMLPSLGGLDVLRRIREASNVPVIMLSARGEDADRIVGLELGADDYLPKPCNPRELMARIRSVLRRGPEGAAATRELLRGDLRLHPAARIALRSGERLELTSLEFDMLVHLVDRAGQVVSRGELAERVMNRSRSPSDRGVDVHISRLRRKLGPRPDGIERIQSVRSIGYIYSRTAED